MMGKHTYVKHVIKKEGRPIGSMIGSLTLEVVVLNDIYLAPEVRGQGFGGRLIGNFDYIPSSFISYRRMRRNEKTLVREVKRMFPWLKQFRRSPEQSMFVFAQVARRI